MDSITTKELQDKEAITKGKDYIGEIDHVNLSMS
jgi:hypothetical protein